MSISNSGTQIKAVGGKPSPQRVWMFAHECAGIAQAGGLGEAVAGLARTLAHDYGRKITVFLPSHGKHLDSQLRKAYGFEELTTFIASGYRRGANGVHYSFLSGVEKGVREDIEFFLVKGLDTLTSRWLDDPVLYDHEKTFEKMALFARTTRAYCDYLMSLGRRAQLPDLIHAHDWHMVPAGVAVKQRLAEVGVAVPLVFSVHLLSRVTLPWHYASEDWCGIRDISHRRRPVEAKLTTMSARQVWEGPCRNSLERFGSYEADYVTSVSESYLANDVMEYVGEEIKGKSGHIYNGCDWDPRNIESTAFTLQPELMKAAPTAKQITRSTLRKYLLTRWISQARSVVPPRDDVEFSGASEGGGRPVEAFSTDGPLVFMTGRLGSQKGADLLIDAVPYVIDVIPNAKFLLFLLPSNDVSLAETIETAASAYPENVKVIFGRHPSVYLISHVAADVYAMPSRSEPFGISALEAMITGNPVVGTNIGGISETVLDIGRHGDNGTGILVPTEDAKGLGESLASLLLVMWIDEQTRRGKPGSVEEAQRIPLKLIQEMAIENPRLGSKIRDNCVMRIEQNFRWRNAGRVALDRYEAAVKLATTGSMDS